MKLNNIRLLVTQFDECLHFYKDVLGLKLTWGEPGGSYASFDTGDGDGLALYKKDLMAEAVATTHLPERANAQDRFVCIFEVADIEQAVEEIGQRGGQWISPIQNRTDWGIRAAHLRDPDGNLIELYTSLAEEQWDPSLQELNKKYES